MQIEIGDWKTKSQIEVADGPPIVHIPEDRVCLHRTGSGGNMKKSKLIFDSLQTRDRRGQLKNGNPPGDPQVAPRCGAKTRRGNGCQAPAMPNGRCRMHGGTSTGPRTAEGLERCRTAKLKHGWYGKAEAAERKRIHEQLLSEIRSCCSILASTTSSTLGKVAYQRLVGFARGVPKGSFLILVWKDPMQSGTAKARTPALHGVLPQFSKKHTR